MDLRDTPEQAAFRAEVRSWLESNLPDGWTEGVREPEEMGERVEFLKQWQRKLYDGGWAGLDWPKEFGGRGIGTRRTNRQAIVLKYFHQYAQEMDAEVERGVPFRRETGIH